MVSENQPPSLFQLIGSGYCSLRRDTATIAEVPALIEEICPVPHIALPEGVPGIAGGLAFRPETAGPMGEFADALLQGPSSLTPGEREMIATFVSGRNDCDFCRDSHRAIAAHQLEGNYDLVDAVCIDAATAPISEKLK